MALPRRYKTNVVPQKLRIGNLWTAYRSSCDLNATSHTTIDDLVFHFARVFLNELVPIEEGFKRVGFCTLFAIGNCSPFNASGTMR